MQEKDMVNDILATINSSIKNYAGIITETSNMQFRQTVQEMRNDSETFQYDLFKIAEQKGYYKQAMQANQDDIMQVKSQVTSG